MFLKISFLLLSFLCAQHAFSMSLPIKDTAINPQAYKLTQQQFIDRYGANDTARALIQYYFKQNKTAKRDILIWTPIGLASSLLFDRAVTNGASGDALGS